MRIEDTFSDLPTLETGRTILRKLRSEDEQDIFRYGSDDEVSRYTSWPTHQTMEDTRHYLNKVLQKYNQHAVAPWGSWTKKPEGSSELQDLWLGTFIMTKQNWDMPCPRIIGIAVT